MKYLLLAYTSLAEWNIVDVTSEEFLASCKFYEDLVEELTGSGELVTTEGLGHPALSHTARRGSLVSEGPFAETGEVLASFAVIDVDGQDRALSIAARIADAVGDTVEVRPIMHG
ncbi:YciI family protein [Dactylosporangium sp. CA-152071]|uniref:YciI family protein n=1 Tax=Dactylosporangium sp. CA-152071 TaxID=3239933 RepID=UPI003D8E1CFD